jgi:hypothetical protein
VALVGGIDDLLHSGDEVGLIVFVRDAHVRQRMAWLSSESAARLGP